MTEPETLAFVIDSEISHVAQHQHQIMGMQSIRFHVHVGGPDHIVIIILQAQVTIIMETDTGSIVSTTLPHNVVFIALALLVDHKVAFEDVQSVVPVLADQELMSV